MRSVIVLIRTILSPVIPFPAPGGGNLPFYTAVPVPGGLLLGARNAVYRYDYATDGIRLLLTFETPKPYAVHTLSVWERGRLLCFNRWFGVLMLDPATGATEPPPFDCLQENTCMLVDSQRRVWLSPYNRGVVCYGADGSLLAAYDTHGSSLSCDVALCMVEREGRIWIGTDGGGIDILDPASGKIDVLKHVPGDRNSLLGNSIRSLCCDGSGSVWAGRVRGGLLAVREVPMTFYASGSSGDSRGLCDESVLCLYREPGSERIWVGTDSGIDRFDPRTGTFEHFPETSGCKVASVSSFSQGRLLLSIFSKGLFLFDPRTGRMRELDCEQMLAYQMRYSGRSVNLCREDDRSVLLLTRPLYRYRFATGRLELLEAPEDVGLFGIPASIPDRDGACRFYDQRRIYALERDSSRVRVLFEIGADTLVNCVSAGRDDELWIASDRGVGCFRTRTGRYEHLATTLFDGARSVACDGCGRVWIGTGQALFAWLPETRRFILFGESDGAVSNEYMPKARLVASDGDVYLGGVDGLLRIDGRFAIDPSDDPELLLTDVELDGERINDRLRGGTLALPWSSTTLAIRIMASEGDPFRRKCYRFRIDGPHRSDDIDTYDPVLTLRSLAPGSYSISAACNTRDGRWTSRQQVLAFTVRPPWYRSGWFAALCVLLLAGGVDGACVLVLRRREQRHLGQLEQQRRQAAEEKVRFLINVSHELRTPLTLVLAPLGRLLGRLPSDAPDFALLRSIHKQALRMKELVNMVLAIRKMEVGGATIRPEPHDLNAWVREISADFGPEAEGRGIAILHEQDEAVGELCFDGDKCRTVLDNLLINALKHSPDGCPIVVRTERFGERVRVSVADRGCGLRNVDPERLFTRFYQGAGERTGSGIGLSYARILVEQHGGAIGAADNSAAGATFWFELPVTLRSECIVCPPRNYLNELVASEEAAEGPAGGGELLSELSLLLVEDDDELMGFLKTALSERVGRLFTARDSVEALQVLGREEVGAIVSDVMMPRMDGYELCREVKGQLSVSHIPVVLLTAREDERSRLLGYKNGADAYMTKPFEVETLLAAVGNLLRNRELIRARYLRGRVMPRPAEATFSSADEAFLSKLDRLIEAHLNEPQQSVSFLCQEMGMSRTVLYNKLKLITGMNVKGYANRIRMERAMTLIDTTDLSFTEIAELTGFSTSRYFSTAFKQYTGRTPSQYKERTAPDASDAAGVADAPDAPDASDASDASDAADAADAPELR